MCNEGVGHLLVQAKVEQAQAMHMMSYFLDEVFQRLKHSLRFVDIQGRRLGQVDFHDHRRLLAPRQILVQLRLLKLDRTVVHRAGKDSTARRIF